MCDRTLTLMVLDLKLPIAINRNIKIVANVKAYMCDCALTLMVLDLKLPIAINRNIKIVANVKAYMCYHTLTLMIVDLKLPIACPLAKIGILKFSPMSRPISVTLP